MRVNQKDSLLFLKRIEVEIMKTLPPLFKLSNETHVWICAGAQFATEIVAIGESHFGREDEVRDYNRGGSGNSLHAVDQYFASFCLRAFYEFNRVVKDARDVLENVVFQVVIFIFNALLLHIVGTPVRRTVDNVRYSNIPELFFIARNQVSAQIKEVIQDFRA